VSFAGLTFRKPADVRFRYRLGGFDEGPTETSLREVRYARLPPGLYDFEVATRSAEGRWSAVPARFRFRVQAPWYRTPVALALWTLGALLAGGGLYQVRVRHLLQERQRLEEAVAQRTAELGKEKHTVEQQAHELVAANEERRRLYAMIVHDLKNPLTPILGGLDFLELGLRPDFAPGQQALETMRQAARRMLFLIESYTSGARGGDGDAHLNLRGVGALDVLSDIALSYTPAARRRGLSVFVNGAPVDDGWTPAHGGATADAPPEKVYRALENIMGNALKYARCQIRLLLVETADRVALVVENDGPGIPPEERQGVFGIYQQLQGSRPGAGVGLASARRQIEQAGGTIQLTDAADGGPRFEVWLPRA
jgi:signal transduction histidine kinase